MADISDITQGADWKKNINDMNEKNARTKSEQRKNAVFIQDAEAAFKAAEPAIFAIEQMRETQRNYIAAYTDRKPGDITETELDNCQDFWNATPQAMADVLAAGIDGIIPKAESNQGQDTTGALAGAIEQMVRHWLLSDTVKYLNFNGADLKAAYLQYGAEGQELVKDALAQADYILSRRYVMAAILPTMEQGFIGALSDRTKKRIKIAFKFRREPAIDTSTFWLFCLLFDMADNTRRATMAAAVGTDQASIELFIQRHVLPGQIIFKAEPMEQAAKPTADSQAQIKRIKADANTIRQLAQNNSNNKYDVSIDSSVFSLIGQDFDKTITDSTGRADFTMRLLERTLIFPYLLEAEDILIAIAWDSIRAAGGRYITPLDIWHKIFWGMTNEDSADSTTEKKLLAELKKGKGALNDIAERIDRLMHLETLYRYYRTEKTAQERKPADLLFEYKNTFIPAAPRVKIPGYKNEIVWETALKNPNEKWDGYTSLPYRAAVANDRLIQFPAEQVDFRKLGINSTLHIATMRDAVIRMVANAQSHGGKLEIPNIDKVYEYGRLNAGAHLELAQAKTPEELRTIKDRQRKRKNLDTQTLARIAEGLKKTGALETAEVKDDGSITAQTAIAWEKKKGKRK